MTRVGFIGLGLMGMPMARNLLKAGVDLTVHNRSRPKVEQLVAEGARAATSPAGIAREVDVLFSCLPGPSDVRAVFLGTDGAVGAIRAGQIVCEMSTIDPGTHREIGALVAERGGRYLDGPVSGGTSGARDATLSIMVGGDAADLATIRPLLDAMGNNIYHLGPIGAGATTKLVNQMMGAICGLSVIEGLTLGVKAGIDPDLLFSVLSTSSGASRALAGNGPNVLRRNFEPGFTIDLQHKDVSLAVQMARELGVPVAAGALAEQVIQAARGLGLGDRATFALVQPQERAAGVEIRGGASS
ncbi:MAG: NAD(P)-dependent oxidoreductase [Chloroflexota bacterium]|nr:MAG: NAD(P)-dependent oxidoreductase [Chloroflexota bacterium]